MTADVVPFQPKDPDGIPRWQRVYDEISQMEIGDTISHRDLMIVAKVRDRGSAQAALRQAVRHLEDDKQRTLDSVRGIGYRMVEANEHERLAHGQRRRATRALTKGKRKAHSADRTLLTPSEAARIDQLEINLGKLENVVKHLSTDVTAIKVKSNGHDDQIALIKSALKQHGIEIPSLPTDPETDSS